MYNIINNDALLRLYQFVWFLCGAVSSVAVHLHDDLVEPGAGHATDTQRVVRRREHLTVGHAIQENLTNKNKEQELDMFISRNISVKGFMLNNFDH